MKRKLLPLILIGLFLINCGINTVSKEQLQNVKAGDVLVYRFVKAADGKTWFYSDKITRVEGDKLYYNPGKMEATAGNDDRLKDFKTDQELFISRDELVRYATEQGDDKKVVIWIK